MHHSIFGLLPYFDLVPRSLPPMFGRKRVREPALAEADAVERMQGRLQDMLAENMIPAVRVRELVNDLADVAPEAPRVTRRRGSAQNAARDLTRAFLRGGRWPEPYVCTVRCHNVRADAEETTKIAFALPHEYLHCLHEHGDPTLLYDSSACDPLTKEHLERCQVHVGAPLVALGLWGDGIPIQWERAESIEHIALNFPGVSGPHSRLRLPLVTLADKHISEHTWMDISEILAWSLRHCVLGTWPVARHDGTPWTAEDRKERRGYPGRHVPRIVVARGTLCEVRMDWKYYVGTFGFPAHNLLAGNCWRCSHTPAQVMRFGSPRIASIARCTCCNALLAAHVANIARCTCCNALLAAHVANIARCTCCNALQCACCIPLAVRMLHSTCSAHVAFHGSACNALQAFMHAGRQAGRQAGWQAGIMRCNQHVHACICGPGG